jgi:hypothetical protein
MSEFEFGSAGSSSGGHPFGFALGRLGSNYFLLWMIPSSGSNTAFNAFDVRGFIYSATKGANFIRAGRGLNLPPIELDYETNALECIGSGAKEHFEQAKALIGVIDKPGYKSSSVVDGEASVESHGPQLANGGLVGVKASVESRAVLIRAAGGLRRSG